MKFNRSLLIGIKIFLFFTLIAIIAFACNKESIEIEEPIADQGESLISYDFPAVFNNQFIGELQIPNGTNVSKINDNSIELTFPEGHYFMDRAIGSEEVVYASSKKYTCTCTGDGCDVFYGAGVVGCSSCTEDCTGSWGTGGGETLTSDEKTYETIGFLDISQDIKLLPSIEDLSELNTAPNNLLDLEQAYEKLEIFYKKTFSSEFVEENNFESNLDKYGLAPVDVYGYAMLLVVPKTKKTVSIKKVFEKSVACACSSGEDGCDLEKIKKFGQTVGYKCVAGGCTSCTMEIQE